MAEKMNEEPFLLPTLLIITDNPSVRFWVKKHMDEDFFVIDAHEKFAAIEAVKNTPLDFILLDSAFEECDALELCKELRQHMPNILTPIFLITGRLKKNYLEHALDVGVTDFINDQLDIDELEMRIAISRNAASLRKKTASIAASIPPPPPVKPKKEEQK